jgi:hypothetical protein
LGKQRNLCLSDLGGHPAISQNGEQDLFNEIAYREEREALGPSYE